MSASPTPTSTDTRPDARPPVPWWAGVFAVIGVLVVVVSLVVATGAVVVAASTRSTGTDISAQGVERLHLVGPTGGASIETDPDMSGRVTGTAVLTTSFREVEVDVEQDGDVLVLSAQCPRSAPFQRCEVSYELTVGPDVDLEVDIVTGGVEATGLGGEVDVTVTTGGVQLLDLTSRLVDVAVTTGGVDLVFDEAPTAVVASTTVGGVSVTVPDDGTTYDVLTSVSVGDAVVAIDTDRDARRSIEATTSVGGVSVDYAGSSRP